MKITSKPKYTLKNYETETNQDDKSITKMKRKHMK